MNTVVVNLQAKQSRSNENMHLIKPLLQEAVSNGSKLFVASYGVTRLRKVSNSITEITKELDANTTKVA